jgi:hypothetical protein
MEQSVAYKLDELGGIAGIPMNVALADQSLPDVGLHVVGHSMSLNIRFRLQGAVGCLGPCICSPWTGIYIHCAHTRAAIHRWKEVCPKERQ